MKIYLIRLRRWWARWDDDRKARDLENTIRALEGEMSEAGHALAALRFERTRVDARRRARAGADLIFGEHAGAEPAHLQPGMLPRIRAGAAPAVDSGGFPVTVPVGDKKQGVR